MRWECTSSLSPSLPLPPSRRRRSYDDDDDTPLVVTPAIDLSSVVLSREEFLAREDADRRARAAQRRARGEPENHPSDRELRRRRRAEAEARRQAYNEVGGSGGFF
jgi:hypothetical protein